jgi:hypothetical protein
MVLKPDFIAKRINYASSKNKPEVEGQTIQSVFSAVFLNFAKDA